MFDRINEGLQTARSVITEVRGLATEGRELLGTAQKFATDNPQAVQTLRSFTTTQGPGLIASVQALVTENPAAVETGRALITQIPGVPGKTGTEIPRLKIIGGSTSSLHADVPVPPEGQREDYYESDPAIFFVTYMAPEDTADFYRSEMPVYDWLLDPESSFEVETAIVLVFTKKGRRAQVIIAPVPGEVKSVVIINLTDQ